jgi:hypothetical protein
MEPGNDASSNCSLPGNYGEPALAVGLARGSRDRADDLGA